MKVYFETEDDKVSFIEAMIDSKHGSQKPIDWIEVHKNMKTTIKKHAKTIIFSAYLIALFLLLSIYSIVSG